MLKFLPGSVLLHMLYCSFLWNLRYKLYRPTGILYYAFIRGRVSKQVTNGSKTAVTDVLGFLCVSLGSSTIQLHNSLGSRRARACSEVGFCSQNGDRAWGVFYRRAGFWCAFFFVSKRTRCKGYSYRNVSCLRWESQLRSYLKKEVAVSV
jgi:hypothetical protein